MNTNRKKSGRNPVVIFILLAVIASACYGIAVMGFTERVPFGHIGVKMTASGVEDNGLQPGNYFVWGRDRLAVIEMSEHTETEHLAVLCKDDLNFGVDVKIRVEPRSGQKWASLLKKQGPQIVWDGDVGTLPFTALYTTYIAPSVRAATREVVSKYATTDINTHRAEIPKAISALLVKKLKGTPMVMTNLETSNFEFPEVVTNAVAKAKAREMEIREETAKAAIAKVKKENQLSLALLDAENRKQVAEKLLEVRTTEAKAEAAYMRIIGTALTDRYIANRQVDSQVPFWKQAGNQATMVITDGNTPLMLGKK